jgi:hypothetical protein
MFVKFSRLSCPLFLITSAILYYMKGNSTLQIILLCVGVLSCMHHARSLNDNEVDILRVLDILFANILGILVFVILGPWSLVYLIPAVILFVISKNKRLPFDVRNFGHMWMHIIICLGIIVQSYLKYKK